MALYGIVQHALYDTCSKFGHIVNYGTFIAGSPSNSNSVAALIPYVIAVICIAGLLLLILCLIFTIIVYVRAKKWRVKEAPKLEQTKVEDTEAVVYEEIDELQQIPKSIHTSKNLAYCHFSETLGESSCS